MYVDMSRGREKMVDKQLPRLKSSVDAYNTIGGRRRYGLSNVEVSVGE